LQGKLQGINHDYVGSYMGHQHDKTTQQLGVDPNTGQPVFQDFANHSDTYNSQVPAAARGIMPNPNPDQVIHTTSSDFNSQVPLAARTAGFDAQGNRHGEAATWQPNTLTYAGTQPAQDNTAQNYEQQAAEHEKMLNLWLGQASDPYMTALDTVRQISDTPLHDYRMQAGMQLGVDPTVMQGKYDMQSQINDFNQQRNMDSIDKYGAPYGEVQAAQNRAISQGEQQANQQQQDQQDQMAAAISQATGWDGNQIASDAGLTLDQAYQAVASQQFQDAAPYIDQAANAGDVEGLKTYLLPLKTADPQLFAIFSNIYAGRLPDGWDA
jgi:hypothetical protein